jgi:CMP-N-acetylneuraminic acid synthetase
VKVLGIIPARAGSKRLPRKNTHSLEIGSSQLWEIAAHQARKAGCDKVIVSTDDKQILRHRPKEPWLKLVQRPAKLSKDSSPVEDAISHVLTREKGYEALCILNPTHPLRLTDDIRECIKDVTWREYPSSTLCWKDYHYTLQEGCSLRTMNAQDRLPRVVVSGECYVVRTIAFIEFRNLMIYGRVNRGYARLSSGPHVDIDTYEDLLCARALWAERNRDVESA